MSKRGMQRGREQDIRDDIRDKRLHRFWELAKYRGGHLYQSYLYMRCVFVKLYCWVNPLIGELQFAELALDMDEMEFVPVCGCVLVCV